MAAANFRVPKVGEECWNSGLDGRLEAVAASIHLEVVAANIRSEFSLWWPFPMGKDYLSPLKRLFVTPELVTQGNESSMTMKESDFPAVLQPECIIVIHTYWTVESTMDTPADKFAIC
jgi:hypothetical protein